MQIKGWMEKTLGWLIQRDLRQRLANAERQADDWFALNRDMAEEIHRLHLKIEGDREQRLQMLRDRTDPTTIRVYGMNLATVYEFRRGFQMLEGTCETPTDLDVRNFFARLRRQQEKQRGLERPDPRQDYTTRDVDLMFRGPAPDRQPAHADEPLPVCEADAGLVLPNPGESGVHEDQPAQGETLPLDHPTHPEQGR